jgi:hypothetical protein
VAGGLLCLLLTSAGSACADPLDHWTLRFKGPPPSQLKTHWDVTFNRGLFVVVGHNGGDSGSIYTSPDGITWTPRHSSSFPNFTLGELRKVIYANGRFVAVGWTYAAYTSENGIDWVGGLTPGLATGLEVGFFDICYGQGKFVATDGRGSSNILTSVDGLYWTRQRTLSGVWGRIAYGDGIFVVLSDPSSSQSSRWLTSSDATVWSYGGIFPSPFRLSGLTRAKGLFVAVGTDSSTRSGVIVSSPDGTAWTEHDYGRTNALGQVECLNGLFIATGDSVLATSTNGIDWESRMTTNMISRFAFGNGTLVGISGYAGFAYWGTDLYQSDPLLSLEIRGANPPELAITGIVGQTCQIESIANLSEGWQPLAEIFLSTSPYSWTDTNATPFPSRIYRGVWRP